MVQKKLWKTLSRNYKKNAVFSRPQILMAILIILLLGFVWKSVMAQDNYKVLGTSTMLLASSGSGSGGDDSGDEDSGGDNSGSGSDNDSDSSQGGSSGSDSSGSESSDSVDNEDDSVSEAVTVSNNTKVLCTGPDGKKFETKMRDCEELNKAWNKPTNFKVITRKSQSGEKKEKKVRNRFLTPTVKTTPDASSSNTPELEEEKEDEDFEIRTLMEEKSEEKRTEIRFSETERIRTRTKDGRTRIDITSGGVKTRYEMRDDRVVIKVEQEDGTEVELEDDTLLKIDDRLAKDNIKIATAGASKFLVQKGKSGAITDFPISVDLATNTVFITTPAGQKAITVLPEEAIQNMLAVNVVNRLGEQEVVDEARNDNITSVKDLVTLGEKNGIPVYEIRGVSDQKLFGFIPVAIEKDLTVSAETGNALSIDQTLTSRIIDALSF